MFVLVSSLYGAYVFFALSLGDKYGNCRVLSRSVYPSPGSRMFAEAVVRYCEQRGQADATVWLSSGENFANSVSVFKSVLTTSEEAVPKGWIGSNFRVSWTDDAKLTVLFPSGMGAASLPDTVSGVTVEYVQEKVRAQQ
jgi:hypothetical protein